jgi:hypothetical protein
VPADEVCGTVRVGVDGWRHPFRMLKHAGTHPFSSTTKGSRSSGDRLNLAATA